jgi:acyl-CoA hydrolase
MALILRSSGSPLTNNQIDDNFTYVRDNALLTGDVVSTGNATTVQKINGVTLSGLATGILRNTTGTGAPVIAVAADFPTLNQNTTGSAATLTTSRNINGVSFNGSADITIKATATNILTFGTNLTGTSYDGSSAVTIGIGTAVALRADTTYIGTTSVALNRTSANLALTGILSVTMQGSTSGSVQIIPTAAVGTGTILTIPATTGTIVTTGDTGTVTNTMLSGSIANAKLINSSLTVGTTTISLGGSSTTLAGLTSVTSTGFTGALTGNATTATTLATARNINGISFNGSADITIKATATNILTIGSGLTGTSYDGSSAVTVAIDSTVALRADTHYIGTTSVALNRASANLALAGISSLTLPGSTSGTVQLVPVTAVGTGTVLTIPATTGTIITTGDSATVTNAMLAGSIANAKLTNSSLTVGTTSISLGSSSTTLAGLTSVTLSGSTSGTVQLIATAISATTILTLPATSGTIVTTGDTGTVTNTMLAGSIANAKLVNSTISGISLGSNLNTLTIGSGLTGTSYNGTTAVTIAIDSTVALKADTTYIGTTSVALNRTSSNLALTGILSVTMQGSTSGSVQIIPTAVAGTGTILTMPATSGTIVTTGDTGTVTNTMLSGSIANTKLTNSSLTVGTTSISLGGSSTTLAGLTSVTSTAFTGALTGNASTATKLATARLINGVSFDGSADITISAATSSLTGLGTGVATFLATPTSANLATAVTDETGTGLLVFGTSPAITTSLTTPSTSFDLINTTATTVNFAKAATILSMGATTGTSTINNDLVVSGNLTVNGTTTTINTATLAVDDKNIELGSVPSATISATGTVGTITGSGPWSAVITGMVSTTGLIVGSSLSATNGTGSLGGSGSYIVTSINSKTQVTYSATGGTTPTAGTITTITTTGYNDITANGAGITVKGVTDKTLNWVGTTTAWTSSENLDIASGKSYLINGTSVLSSSTLGSGVTASSLTSVGTLNNLVYSGTLTGGTGIINIGSGQIYKDASGNVGIGTSSPVYKLDISGPVRVNIPYSQIVQSCSTGGITTGGYIRYTSNGGGSYQYQINTAAAGDFTTARTAYTIDASGNVGIGTSSPSSYAGKVVSYNNTNSLASFTALSGLAASSVIEIQDGAATPNRWWLLSGLGTTTDGTFSIYDKRQSVSRLAIDSAGNVGIGTSGLTSKLSIKGTTATDAPTLGTEFITGGTWTSTGWTGDNTTGWVNGASNSTALSYSVAAVVSTRYQITYTVTGYSAGSFTVAFGGQSLAGITATGTFGPTTTSTANLVITPTATFVGTIVVSIKAITAASTVLITALDSTGTARFEVRASSADANTFLGLSSGRYNTTGYYNSAMGSAALQSNTTGYQNSAVGSAALQSNTTGYFNSAMGSSALQSNTTGYFNSAVGQAALSSNTTGYFNSAMGRSALQSNTTGVQNSAMGVSALLSNTTGYFNSAMGRTALQSNTTGAYNSAMGVSALLSNTTGANNSTMGVSALQSNTTGAYNSAMGVSALLSNTTGANNSAMGVSALQSNTTGVQNSAVGTSAGRYIADGVTALTIVNNSTYLGYLTKASADNVTNETVIGYNATGAGANTTVIGTSATVSTTLFGNIIINNGAIGSATLTTSATTASQVIDTNSSTVYRSVKYDIQMTSSTSYHSCTITIIHDGTTAYMGQYADIYTGVSLATFDADISGGTLRLLTTPTNAVTVYKVIKTLINI